MAFFFLISGFVIPFSLGRLREGGFLIARIFRIYPTYWTCLGVGILALKLGGAGPERELGWGQVLANALLIHPYCGQSTLDYVNWTLVIEERFYLLVALLGASLVQRRFTPMLIFSFAVLGYLRWYSTAAAGLMATPRLYHLLHGFAVDTHYLIYMLIGSLFFQHYRGTLRGAWLIFQSLALLALFSVAWAWSPSVTSFPNITYNYFYSFFLFALAYRLRDRWVTVRPLEWLAAISYPMYAVHTLFGFVLMQHLIRSGWSYYPTLAVTLPLLFGLSYLIHRSVEKPTQIAGKRLAAVVAARKSRNRK